MVPGVLLMINDLLYNLPGPHGVVTQQNLAPQQGPSARHGMTIRHQEACGENGILAEMMHPDHPEQRLHAAVTQLGAVWVKR